MQVYFYESNEKKIVSLFNEIKKTLTHRTMSISMNEIIFVLLRNKFDPIQHDNILVWSCLPFYPPSIYRGKWAFSPSFYFTIV